MRSVPCRWLLRRRSSHRAVRWIGWAVNGRRARHGGPRRASAGSTVNHQTCQLKAGEHREGNRLDDEGFPDSDGVPDEVTSRRCGLGRIRILRAPGLDVVGAARHQRAQPRRCRSPWDLAASRARETALGLLRQVRTTAVVQPENVVGMQHHHFVPQGRGYRCRKDF